MLCFGTQYQQIASQILAHNMNIFYLNLLDLLLLEQTVWYSINSDSYWNSTLVRIYKDFAVLLLVNYSNYIK